MSDVSKRFEQFVKANQKKLAKSGVFLPIKIEDGILVGQAKIVSDGLYKNVFYKNELIYKNINLNSVAVKLANGLASKINFLQLDEIYQADQEYDKFFTECAIFYNQLQLSIKKNDEFRRDLFSIRYSEAKEKCKIAKEKAQRLSKF